MQLVLNALDRLKDGNERFVTKKPDADVLANPLIGVTTNGEVAAQKPFAVILGCSDSRVPAELIFNQGFGSLFVIRVAGNVLSPPQMGSVEFAVQNFGTPLVVVLGHTHCGAVAATIGKLEQPDTQLTPGLNSIVDLISPAVKPLLDSPLKDDKAALIAQATRVNVHLAAEHLRHESPVLEQRIADKELLVVGAEYSLETGEVEFFDGLPV